MIYSFEELQNKVNLVAEQYDILEVRLFGSYFNGTPTEQSDVDLIVKYGPECNGLNRISFMNALEEQLGKDVDVINIDFLPAFLLDGELNTLAWYQLIFKKQGVTL